MDSCARELMTLPPSTRIDGRYEIDRCIGIGSMSVVYAAHRISDGLRCALKILSPADSTDISSATFHTRFRIGARMAQIVDHPNVVKVLDFIDQPDLLAAVMELVEGGDLAARLQSRGAYPVPEAIRVFKQILAGMRAIHDAGITHRDIKPANILLDKSGDARISDFGIARSGDTPRLTAQGGIVGTIQYLSPEQLQGEQASQLSDIYALGIVAYEMVTGVVPGADHSLFKLVDQRVSAEVIPVQIVKPQCPPAFSNIIGKALQRNPADRFQSVAEMLSAMESVGQTAGSTDDAPSISSQIPPVLQSIKKSRAWEIFQGAGFQLVIAISLITFFAAALRLPSSSNGLPSASSSSSPSALSANTALSEAARQDSGARASLKLSEAPTMTEPQSPASEDLAALSAKQTLLYRMADFVRWPKATNSSPGMPLRLCILGKDPFGLSLDRILSKSKTRSGQGFWLQRYVPSTASEQLKGCQILYVGDMTTAQVSSILTPLRALPVLTVSEGTGQGIVDFVTHDGRASFVVNQALAKQSGLELSSILLDVGANAGDGK